MTHRPSEGSGHWNRSGRRGGGDRPAVIPVGRPAKTLPLLSIQCFERRHGECFGSCAPFAPGRCECPCHGSAEANP